MFAKLLVVIVVMGAVAGALLVNRQQRLEAAHRAAVLHRELVEQRQQLWAARAEVAAACRPQAVRVAMEASGEGWHQLTQAGATGANRG